MRYLRSKARFDVCVLKCGLQLICFGGIFVLNYVKVRRRRKNKNIIYRLVCFSQSVGWVLRGKRVLFEVSNFFFFLIFVVGFVWFVVGFLSQENVILEMFDCNIILVLRYELCYFNCQFVCVCLLGWKVQELFCVFFSFWFFVNIIIF